MFDQLIDAIEYEQCKTGYFSDSIQKTLKEKEKEYGLPEPMLKSFATKWSNYLGLSLDAVDVSMMMALGKQARLEFNPAHEDSKLDKACYLALAVQSLYTASDEGLIRAWNFFNQFKIKKEKK